MIGTYASLLRRYAPAIVLLSMLLAPLGFTVLLAGQDSWTSTSVLQVGTPSVGEGVLGTTRAYEAPQQRLATELEVLGSDVVAERAARRLTVDGMPTTVAELRSMVKAEARGASALIEIEGTGSDPRSAQRRTQAVVDAYVGYQRDDQREQLVRVQSDLQGRLAAAEQELAALDGVPATDGAASRQRAAALARYETINDLLEQVRLRLGVELGGVQVLTPPTLPSQPDRALGPAAAAVAAVVASLLVSTGLAVLIDLLRNPVRTRAEAEELTLVPVLAEIPTGRAGRHAVQARTTDAGSAPAVAARALRLQIASKPHGLRLVVLSGTARDLPHSVTVATLLATVCARAGHDVLLLADSPTACALADGSAGTPGAPGAGAPMVHRWPTIVDRLTVGTLLSTTAELGLLDVKSPQETLDSLLAEHDVVVAVPPSVVGAEFLVGRADTVVLVCELGRTRAPELARRAADVERDGAELAGLVLVGSRARGRARDAAAEGEPQPSPTTPPATTGVSEADAPTASAPTASAPTAAAPTAAAPTGGALTAAAPTAVGPAAEDSTPSSAATSAVSAVADGPLRGASPAGGT